MDIKNIKNFRYESLCSSYVLTDNAGFGMNAANHNGIIGYLDKKAIEAFKIDNYDDNFDLCIRDKSTGEILNAYEKMILNSQWDCRDNGDYQTIILGREYMFYEVDGKITSKEANKIDEEKELIFKLTYKNPIELFPYINEQMINNKITAPFDEGQILKMYSGGEIDATNNLEKMLDRNKCRKFSENHFAISGFNLIGHSISINSNVCNTMSEILDDDKKNTISILGDVDIQYIVEQTAIPEFPTSSMSEESDFEHRSDEFLANKLLEELRYCYQGSIIIKFNPDIEIGDTITLMDNVSSTYGVFQVDSYEHSLDQRGLITSLIVRASWTPKDPILDYHSQNIGYDLIKKIKEHFKLEENSNDTNTQIYEIASLYLKYIVQSPKYCVFYKKKEEGFFNKSTVYYNNISSPTALPLRFFPMYIKGVQQMPKSLKYAFVIGAEKNSIKSLLSSILSTTFYTLKECIYGFGAGALKVFYFISDMLISTVTFNLSELIKPLLGFGISKAEKNTFDDIVKMDKDDALNMLQYNPYEKKYKLLYNNFDIVFGFFNIRLQKQDDLYAGNKLLEKTAENNKNLLIRKVEVVKKMLNDVFDALLLVELYDGFKADIGNSSIYTFEDFLNDCTSNLIDVSLKEKITTNTFVEKDKTITSNEYGAVLKRKNVKDFSYETINIEDGKRKAIVFKYDISSFNLKRKGSFSNFKELIIIFFHNLYGDNKDDNDIGTRRKNIDDILNKYKSYCESETTGVVIMADFNLNVYNHGDKPYDGFGTSKNFTYELKNNDFVAQIKTPTTLKSNGKLRGNQYDNVLLSKNINGLISAKVFEYPEKDKLTISDHVPIYIGIKKMQG